MKVETAINTHYMLTDRQDRHINMICACCSDGCCKHCDKLDIVDPNATIVMEIPISNDDMDKILSRRNMVTAWCEYEHVNDGHESSDYILCNNNHDFKISQS